MKITNFSIVPSKEFPLKNKKKKNHADNLIITWLLGIPGKDPKDYDKTH